MIVEPLHLNLDLVDPDAVQTVNKIITLTNSHPHKMAFKIRTTARERYRRPILADGFHALQTEFEYEPSEISSAPCVYLKKNNAPVLYCD